VISTSLLALLSPASADAKCAMVELGPKVITATTAKIPTNGGVLVGWDNAHDNVRTEGDPSVQKSWKATAGGKPVELAIETLAPGLSVYRPKSTAGFALSDGKQALGTFTRATTAAADLPAPEITALTLDARRGRRGGSEFSVSATFAKVADAAVAVILYRGKTALSFGMVEHDGNKIVVDDGPHHCSFPPPGTTLPANGDAVTLAWVDAFGHVGATSAAITIH
jgi:hypothetical protein